MRGGRRCHDWARRSTLIRREETKIVVRAKEDLDEIETLWTLIQTPRELTTPSLPDLVAPARYVEQ